MSARASVQNIGEELQRTRKAQADAADPRACVWVSANAGTGKTHVLTMRVLRLLLEGTPPQRILCLTYTKAAAAEMSKRVFDELASWVMLPPNKLAAALLELTGERPLDSKIALARTLFTAAIETPGGLKIQTIHAFCERLLQRFPLEAGVTPGFAILEEDVARKLRRQSIDEMLTSATRTHNGHLGEALNTAIAYAAEDRFDEIIESALEHREWLESAVRMIGSAPERILGLPAVDPLFRRHLGVRSAATPISIASELMDLMPDSLMARVSHALGGGSKSDIELGRKVGTLLGAASAVQRAGHLHGFLTKSDGEPRDKFFTNGLARDHAGLDIKLKELQPHALRLCEELQAASAIEATMALHQLADAVMQNYKNAKARRAGLDFDDLISHTTSLLATGTSPEWVLYKLDNGLDHILVDESQDTSPDQWKVVEALATEFFSGPGGRAAARTIFAVGDEKQSIYSFQGAAPEMFSGMGDRFAALATGAGAKWRPIPLHVSFRTVAPILQAIDRVFSDADVTPGLSAKGARIQHSAKRQGHGGLVELWAPEAYTPPAETDAWSPLDEGAESAPAVRLANRIASQIKSWIDNGERLVSENRPVTAGDILILVRKRQPFAAPMVAALKAAGVPVAGADRISLSQQIAVQDLMALGDVLTLPEADLALAEVLKSPMFGLDDDDLLKIAVGRKGTLWQSLLRVARVEPRFAPAAAHLKKWRRIADFVPPFEFFASILDGDGMRKKLIARLGPDAVDAIDEFLNLALNYDESAPPSLSGFLAWVREDDREIKRDLEHSRIEVRVMTVHGAKGLEAPIVFLPDTCSAGSAGSQGGKPLPLPDMPRPSGLPPPLFWPVKGAAKLGPIEVVKGALKAKDDEERNRLLYVAMTRARDRLYIAGFEGKKGRATGCWYDLIGDALGSLLTSHPLADGRMVRRLAQVQTAQPEQKPAGAVLVHPARELPAWASRPAPREPQLAVPLAPSRLAPYDSDDSGEPLPVEPSRDTLIEPFESLPTTARSSGASSAGNDARFLRGSLTHALLQYLPAIDAAQWSSAAARFVGERGGDLPRKVQSSICSETLSILNDPRFSALFGPMSHAEVPIVAEIARPAGKTGPPLRLTGQIDRLAVDGGDVLIVDYKTNRRPPAKVEGVADVYLYQLAAYRLALSLIFKDKNIRAMLLWTEGTSIIEVPAVTLDRFTAGLWQLDTDRLQSGRLDA